MDDGVDASSTPRWSRTSAMCWAVERLARSAAGSHAVGEETGVETDERRLGIDARSRATTGPT